MKKKRIIILDKGIKDTVGPRGICCPGAFAIYRW